VYVTGKEQGRPMIVFTMRVAALPEKRRDMLQALRSLLGPMSVLPGCLRCRLYQDANDEGALTWVEEWESREQLDRHVRSAEYRTLLSVMDLSAVRPEVRFDTVVKTAGMELIEDTMKGRD
jgi:quinol monooxygenase YgiN